MCSVHGNAAVGSLWSPSADDWIYGSNSSVCLYSWNRKVNDEEETPVTFNKMKLKVGNLFTKTHLCQVQAKFQSTSASIKKHWNVFGCISHLRQMWTKTRLRDSSDKNCTFLLLPFKHNFMKTIHAELSMSGLCGVYYRYGLLFLLSTNVNRVKLHSRQWVGACWQWKN